MWEWGVGGVLWGPRGSLRVKQSPPSPEEMNCLYDLVSELNNYVSYFDGDLCQGELHFEASPPFLPRKWTACIT